MSTQENSNQSQGGLFVSSRPQGKALRFLHLLVEQNAITVGQLTRFLRVPRPQMERFLAEAVKERWVAKKRLLTGDDIWVWIDYPGAELIGSRFQVVMPARKDLRSIRAVNEARLRVESSNRPLEWICKRKLTGPKRVGSRLPDAEVLIDGQRHVVEVELSQKKGTSLRAKLRRYEEKYAGVLYFAPVDILQQFKAVGVTKEAFPKLRMVKISVESMTLDKPQWRIGLDQLPQPANGDSALSEFELGAIDLLAEQGGIPRDQLRRFLGLGEAETDRLVARFLRMDLVECAKPLPDEPYWVWLTSIGVRWSSWDLAVGAPGLGALERLRALNELRLHATRSDKVVWTSDRVLRSRYRVKGSCPDALVKVGAETHAFDLVLYAGNSGELKTRLAKRRKRYRVMVWFYAPEAQADLEKFVAKEQCRSLVIRPLPGGEYLDARAWNRKRSARNNTPYCSNHKTWADWARAKPATMYPIVADAVPEAALRVIGVAVRSSRLPRLTAASKRRIGGHPVYYIETDVGKFRVTHVEGDWIADEVVREDVFVREGGPPIDPRGGGWRRTPTGPMVESKKAQVSDEIWAAVVSDIPPVRGRKIYRGTNPTSDREVLAALIWQLRDQADWQRLPVGMADGTDYRILVRLREWEEMGVWAKVRPKLEELLPNGRELDWSRLDPASLLARRPLNDRQRAFLARAVRGPKRRWTIETYSASFGIRPDSGKGDLWKLAALGLVVHMPGDDGVAFEPVDGLVEKLRRLLQ